MLFAMKRYALTLLAAILISAPILAAEPAEPTGKWASAMKQFAEMDEASPVAKGGVVFVGSSSIRKWDLPMYFPNLPVLNRGFGGSQVADSLEHADLLVIKHAPRLVVMYAGDNDLAAKKTPERVSDDFAAFVKKVHAKLPETKIAYIAVKPSISRWKLVDQVRAANKLIIAQCEANPLLSFIDIDKPMIGADGLPRKELFANDGLHLSPAGYELWTELVMPHVVEK